MSLHQPRNKIFHVQETHVSLLIQGRAAVSSAASLCFEKRRAATRSQSPSTSAAENSNVVSPVLASNGYLSTCHSTSVCGVHSPPRKSAAAFSPAAAAASSLAAVRLLLPSMMSCFFTLLFCSVTSLPCCSSGFYEAASPPPATEEIWPLLLLLQHHLWNTHVV